MKWEGQVSVKSPQYNFTLKKILVDLSITFFMGKSSKCKIILYYRYFQEVFRNILDPDLNPDSEVFSWIRFEIFDQIGIQVQWI